MKYLSKKNGFLGIDNKINTKEKVVVVPFGLEKTVSYGSGTSKGPAKIIKASHQVELFDEDLNKEPYKSIGIKTLKPFPIKKNIVDAIRWVLGEQKASILRSNKMEEVIFNGTQKKKPLNFCEATLTIENNKDLLPI